MSLSPVAAPIAFSCTHCAMELTVPIELAGVAGPCPNCGQTIQSPAPLMEPASFAPAVSVDVLASNEQEPIMPPRKLQPRPRAMKSKPRKAALEEPVGPLMQSAAAPRIEVSRGHGRAIHPVVGLSSKYDDKKELGDAIRIALAVLLVLGVVIAVTMFMTKQ